MKVILTLPVYNEEKILANSATTLVNYFRANLNNHDWQIIIADNGSTDKTLEISKELKNRYPEVCFFSISGKGRGLALREVWQNTDADIYAYCDIDLATGIQHFPALINSIAEGADIAVGSRYTEGSVTNRQQKRLIISKVYIWLVKNIFKTKITDFQCGFKAIGKSAKNILLPLTKNNEWFFDTELILLGKERNLKINEVPVTWQENKETKVKFIINILGFLKCLTSFHFGKKSKNKK